MSEMSCSTARKSISLHFLRDEPLRPGSSQWATNSSTCGGCGEHVSWLAPLFETFSSNLIPDNHHCRNCGLTFCDECCKVRMSFRCGTVERVCLDCSALVDHQTAAQNIQKWFRDTKKKKELKSLLETSRDALVKREEQCNKLEQENEKLCDNLTVAQTEIRSLWEAQSTTQRQLSELAKTLSVGDGEPDDLHTAVHVRISALEGTISDLRSEVSTATASNEALLEKSASLARCNSSLVSLNNELTVRTSKLADRVEKLLSVKIDLQERNQTLALQNEDYKSEVAELNNLHRSLAARNQELSASNNSLHTRVEELSGEVHTKTLEIEEKEGTIRQQEQTLSETRRQMHLKDAELRIKSQELERCNDQLEVSVQEIAQKDAVLLETKRKLREKEARLDIATQANSKMAQKLQFSAVQESSLQDRVRVLERAISEVAVAVQGAEIKDPVLLKRLVDLQSLGLDLSQCVQENSPQFEGYEKRPGYFRGKSLDPQAIAIRANMNVAHKELNVTVVQHNKRQWPKGKIESIDSSDSTEIVYPEKPPKTSSETESSNTPKEVEI